MSLKFPTLFLLMQFLWACGGTTSYICPEGREYTNGLCCPTGMIGAANQCIWPQPDFDVPPVPDFGIVNNPDPGPQSDPGQIIDQGSFPDFNIPDTYIETDGAIGSPCMLDGHCLDDGICLSWWGGYCTLLGCFEDPTICTEGTTCTFTGGNGACLKDCATSEDCRVEKDHACKTLESATGDFLKVCMGTQAGASPLGGICAADDNCMGEAACYGGVPGGMCVVNACGLNTCDEGSSCIAIDGVPRCLKNCTDNTECPGGTELGRSCEEMKSLNGTPVNACFVPQGDSPIGDACTGGFACASGTCKVVATGVCSISPGVACSASSDCPDGEVCNQAATYVQGICTQECTGNQVGQCDDSSSCISSPDESYCAKPCSGIADPECQIGAGLICSFGYPLGSSNGNYLCSGLGNASPIQKCSGDPDCAGENICLWDGLNEGYCLENCASNGKCSFPTHCVQLNGGLQNRCFKSCNADWDCPEAMKCDFPADSSKKACVQNEGSP